MAPVVGRDGRVMPVALNSDVTELLKLHHRRGHHGSPALTVDHSQSVHLAGSMPLSLMLLPTSGLVSSGVSGSVSAPVLPALMKGDRLVDVFQ